VTANCFENSFAFRKYESFIHWSLSFPSWSSFIQHVDIVGGGDKSRLTCGLNSDFGASTRTQNGKNTISPSSR
jgi:hypothetical protein